jgi:DNA-binding CsgD family transcriptional regulator
MREVSVRMLHFATDLARAGVDERQLLEGIAGLRSGDLATPGRIDRDDFVDRAKFPEPPPLKARGRQAVSAATALIAAQIDDLFARIAESFTLERPTPGAPHADGEASWSRTLALSPRQREVFTLLIEGRANEEIAHLLGCSERNVEFHVGRILRAARVSSRAELLVKVLALPPPRP